MQVGKKHAEQKPWGGFEQFTHNEPSTVKILTINPHEALSLQYHRSRDEFWKVLSGSATITVGDSTHHANEGDEFFISQGQKHRIQTEEYPTKILEISFGDFDEFDIVRLEDKYNRSKKST